MASTIIREQFITTTGGGTADGTITLAAADYAQVLKGVRGWLTLSDGTLPIEVEIVDLLGSNKVALRQIFRIDSTDPQSREVPRITRPDLSSYVTGSKLAVPHQVARIEPARAPNP